MQRPEQLRCSLYYIWILQLQEYYSNQPDQVLLHFHKHLKLELDKGKIFTKNQRQKCFDIVYQENASGNFEKKSFKKKRT